MQHKDDVPQHLNQYPKKKMENLDINTEPKIDWLYKRDDRKHSRHVQKILCGHYITGMTETEKACQMKRKYQYHVKVRHFEELNIIYLFPALHNVNYV